MTHVGPPPVNSPTTSTAGASFVEWGAVLAGAVLAAAISFVLLTFGTAIGLSAASPWPNAGASVKLIASLAVFWALAQQIGAFMAGGYVAGRMRSRWHEKGHEAEFRDGLHGGLVWAVGVVIGAALFFSTAGAATKAGAEIAGRTAASTLSSTNDPMDAVLDTMLRPTIVAQATPPSSGVVLSSPAAAPASPASARGRTTSLGSADDGRAEMSRILTASVGGGPMSNENRTYLAQLVAQRSGLSQADSERRVNEAVTAAREAADKARHAAVLTGFVTAAGLILSLGAAWWAAIRGGHHRDNSIPARFEFGDRRRITPSA
jgi:hypothetical protein